MNKSVLTIGALFIVVATATAQNNDTANGYIPGHSYVSKDIDTIDLATGGVSIHIPLLSFKEQDPVSIDYSLSYTSHHLAYSNGDLAYGGQQGWAWVDSAYTPSMPSAELIGGTATSYAGVKLATNQDWRATLTTTLFVHHYPEVVTPDGGMHLMLADANDLLHSTDATGIAAGNFIYAWSNYNESEPVGVYDSVGVAHTVWAGGGQMLEPAGTQYPLYQNRGYSNVPQIVFGQDQRPAYITDAIGRQLPWPDLFTGTIGPMTTDYSKCTGPLPVNQAFVVSFPNGKYIFCYTQIQLQTNFNSIIPSTVNYIPGGEYSNSHLFLQSIYLPNGRSWVFEYQDRDASDGAAINYGTLTKVVYPTGASVTYAYEISPTCRFRLYDLTATSRRIKSRTEINGAGQVATWTYNYIPGDYSNWTSFTPDGEPHLNTNFTNTILTVRAPDGGTVVHEFEQNESSCAAQELKTTYQDALGNGLGTTTHSMKVTGTPSKERNNDGSNSYIGGSFSYAPYEVVDTLPNGQTSYNVKHYDNQRTGIVVYVGPTYGVVDDQYLQGKVTEEWVYDYGGPAAGYLVDYIPATTGSLLRHTKTTYEFQSNPSAVTQNLLDLVDSQIEYDALGNIVGSNINTYATSQLADSSYLVTLQSAASQIDSSSVNSTSFGYDANGNVISSTDANHHTTSYGYDPTFTYRTTVTEPLVNGISPVTQTAFDWLTGTVHSTTDENNNLTTYGYDGMLRLTSVIPTNTSVSGAVTLCYGEDVNQHCPDAQSNDPLNTVYARVAQNASTGAVATAKQSYDGFGRPYITGYKDSLGWIDTKTSYDLLGRTQSQTLPFREGHSASGLTWTDYDSLNRVLDQKQEDSSGAVISQTSKQYTNNQTDIWDGDNHHSRQIMDAAGRLTEVLEPDATNNPSLETDYTYDVLGNLVHVHQVGLAIAGEVPRDRSFSYDGLSRLRAAWNPETGTATGACPGTTGSWSLCYGYDLVGNLISKVDARGYTTAMSYDARNRLQTKQYYNPQNTLDAGTPSTCFQYDLPSVGLNYKGKLAAEWTQNGACAPSLQSANSANAVYSSRKIAGYDSAGRVLSETKCILANCFPSGAYTYDLVGNLLQYFNQKSNVLLSYDNANRLSTITAVDPATSQATPLYTLTSAGPAGPLTINLGSSMTKVMTYDSLHRKTSETTINVKQ